MEDVTGPVVALVPARSPGVGKTRLSRALTPEQRAALSGAMLADVASALADSAVDRVVVAASGAEAAAVASALRLDVVLDPPGVGGLDRAIAAAVARLGRVATLLVLTADLPRLRADDVERLLASDAEVAIAGTDDGGTGGLVRRPSTVMGTAYGQRSAERHERLARTAGLRVRVHDLAGFRHDVDTWDDLVALRRGHVGQATGAFLASIRDRLDAAG